MKASPGPTVARAGTGASSGHARRPFARPRLWAQTGLEPRRWTGTWRGHLIPWLLSAGLLLSAFAEGSPITAGPTRIDNAYPEQIAFEVDLSSSDGAITRAELQLSLRGDSSATILPATLTGGTPTTARAEWKTRRGGVPPGAAYVFQWRVWDEAGQVLTTPPQQEIALDPSRPWAELRDERVGVWWYEGSQSFGRQIFDLASNSLRQMEQESGLELPFRLHVVLYPDSASFAEWHDYVLDWVGGEAYPALGLTVQIVAPPDSPRWLQAVICHEVAHLFFHQATYNALSLGPTTWINEGYAQHHECLDDDWQQELVEDAMRRGELIPLRLATGSFSGDNARISLLYAESWSAIDFVYDRWGEQGMAALLQAFRQGADSNDALRQATGLDFEAFQQAWWEWLGGAPGAYPTPASPATAAPLASPLPPPTISPTGGPATPALPPPPESAIPTPWHLIGLGVCGCVVAALALLLGGAVVLKRVRRKRVHPPPEPSSLESDSPPPASTHGVG